ncbi:MAG: histone deacetylase [Rhodoferax sp.]
MRVMKAFYADHFVLDLPAGHRFPMRKYQLLHEGVAQHWPQIRLLEAPAAAVSALARVHSQPYIDAVLQGHLSPAAQREIGFPWSPRMAERALRSVGATVAAMHWALRDGVAANLAGGTHHAYADKGGGFCVFNDIAVAARQAQADWAQAHGTVMPIAVLDLDVHQGNGTAHIFSGDPSVYTCSLHGEKNFPFRKEASDLDIGLPDNCTDADYLCALDQALEALWQHGTPALLFYLAGADPYVGDRLGRLALSAQGLRQRDARVFAACAQRGVPVVMVMGGGYADPIEDTVTIQLASYGEALAAWQRWQGGTRRTLE